VVVLRRSARDRTRRAHVHRLDLDDGERLGRPPQAGRFLHQARDLQGAGRRRPQQPVARVPTRRAHRRLLLPALRPLPAAAEPSPQPDALPDLQAPVLDQRFSYTRDGRTWVPARELLRSNDPERPYSKYVGDGNRRIHGIFTEGHANHFKNSLYYLRYENSGLFAASGRRLGTLRSVPLHITKLDRIYKFTNAKGSAWPHDIALTSEGRPRIVYTRRVGHRDAFFYAYHNGDKWVSRKIVDAGPGFSSFTSGGATLDHEDPRVVYLSRRSGAFHQVEAWFTDFRTRIHALSGADAPV
jgi:hypothetical protein